MPMPMAMDLEGFVHGNIPLAPTPPQRCLLPLYEAITNSIQSIQAAQQHESKLKGRIDIHIHRDKGQGVLQTGDGRKIQLYPLDGFTIEDNGIGFDDANFRSFNTAFTQLKRHLGGKGRGRFMWLKVFSLIEVESVFTGNGTAMRRAFTFTLKDARKGGEEPTKAEGRTRKTTVKLSGMLKPFKDHCPKHAEAIAGHLLRRFVTYIALPTAPDIFLHDPEAGQDVELKTLFNDLKVKTDQSHFTVQGKGFELNHFLLHRRGDLKHELHFCAHGQAVAPELLDSRLPDLKAPIREGDAAVVYHGYVSSGFLDTSVNPERTDFDKVADGQMPYDGAIPWREIVDASVSQAAQFLDPYTRSTKAEKKRRITEYVQTAAPWYRHVVKQRPEIIEAIPPAASQNDIDVALYQASKDIEVDLRNKAAELLELGHLPDDPADYRNKLDQFLEQFGDVGKDQLAKYVAHRKAILSFLFDRLKLRTDGKHYLESDIHNVIFPMRATSDDVEPERMNLWIIDERLAFHYYLASDKPLRSVEPITIDSGKELDLLIFDRPFFFGEGEVDLGAAVIVEFKRPMTDDRNPIDQVYDYVRTVRAGTVTKDNRTLKVKAGTPFYAYVLCDLTPKMRQYPENAGFHMTPDEEGYVGYNAAMQVYVEVISYQKAILDAQKRNAILFHKLGLPPELKKPELPKAAEVEAGVDESGVVEAGVDAIAPET